MPPPSRNSPDSHPLSTRGFNVSESSEATERNKPSHQDPDNPLVAHAGGGVSGGDTSEIILGVVSDGIPGTVIHVQDMQEVDDTFTQLSENESSNEGPVFSLLSGQTSSLSVPHRHELANLQAWLDHYLLRNNHRHYFPWNIHFSWKNSELIFGDVSIRLTGALKARYSPSSPNAGVVSPTPTVSFTRSQREPFRQCQHKLHETILGAGSFAEGLSQPQNPNRSVRELDVTSTTCSLRSGCLSCVAFSVADLDPRARYSDYVAAALKGFIQWIVEILVEDYDRLYGQGESDGFRIVPRALMIEFLFTISERSNTSQAFDTDPGSGPSQSNGRKRSHTVTEEGNPPPSKLQSNAHKKKISNGSAESEGEDSTSERQVDHFYDVHRKEVKYYACPYLKLNLKRYARTCLIGSWSEIHHVKNHLEEVHYREYCRNCFIPYGKDMKERHKCHEDDLKRTEPPEGFMTKEMYKKIKKHGNSGRKLDKSGKPSTKNENSERRWRNIYKVLFPNEPPCHDPYMREIDIMIENYFRDYFVSGRPRDIWQQMVEDDMNVTGQSEIAMKLIYPLWISRVLSMEIDWAREDYAKHLGQKLHHNEARESPCFNFNEMTDMDTVGQGPSHSTNTFDLQRTHPFTPMLQAYPDLEQSRGFEQIMAFDDQFITEDHGYLELLDIENIAVPDVLD